LKADNKQIKELQHELKEANKDTAGETLLTGMYQALPYEHACGSLADDPAKIRTTQVGNKGACAAKCAEISACKSFQFTDKNCVLSKKKIIRNSKYGELLACATKNVLIKQDMKVSSNPTVYQKKQEEHEEEQMDDLGESYGFETEQEVTERKKAAASPVPDATKVQGPPEAKRVEDATDKRWQSKLKAQEDVSRECSKELESLKKASQMSTARDEEIKKLKAELQDYKMKYESKNAEEQQKIKAAVDAAKADTEKQKQKELQKEKDSLKKEEQAKVSEEVKKKTTEEKKVADAKLSKGRKDEAIAKEALKKALTLSDAEKKEMAQNKKLAQRLGKEKTKALLEKKEKMAFESELKESKVVDKARLQKQKNKVEQLETQEINDSAKKAEAEEQTTDEKGMQKKLIRAAQHLAIGMSLKMKEIKMLKKRISKHKRKHKSFRKKIRKITKAKKKADVKFGKCEKDKATKLRNARHKYNTSIEKLKDTMQTTLTQSELAKRALQLCEQKERGASGRAAMRVARRENRAVRRAKRKMGEKKHEKEVEKQLKVKLEAKVTKKLKAKEAKDVAKKVEKLTNKKVSPKCKACLKLNEAEQKMVGADCKACT